MQQRMRPEVTILEVECKEEKGERLRGHPWNLMDMDALHTEHSPQEAAHCWLPKGQRGGQLRSLRPQTHTAVHVTANKDALHREELRSASCNNL